MTTTHFDLQPGWPAEKTMGVVASQAEPATYLPGLPGLHLHSKGRSAVATRATFVARLALTNSPSWALTWLRVDHVTYVSLANAAAPSTRHAISLQPIWPLEESISLTDRHERTNERSAGAALPAFSLVSFHSRRRPHQTGYQRSQGYVLQIPQIQRNITRQETWQTINSTAHVNMLQ